MQSISVKGWSADNIVHHGNKFLIGNIYLGYRGTLEEFRKEQLVALNVPLVYDQVGTKWREPINAPNPWYTLVKFNGIELNPLSIAPTQHEQILDIETAVHRRRTTYQLEDTCVTIEVERFISQEHYRLLMMRYRITATHNGNISIETGIDGDVWDINGPHLVDATFENKGILLKYQAVTNEKRIPLTVFESLQAPTTLSNQVVCRDELLLHHIEGQLSADAPIEFIKYAYVSTGHHDEESLFRQLVSVTYEHHLADHQQKWVARWRHADVVIEGDEVAQEALRYSIYHLLTLSPDIRPGSSIPARGISGQTYKGAIFWDTEMFMLPFYLNTNPGAAQSIIDYRIHGLQGAIQKAKSYGYRGAFYAWESQEDGFDACSDYNVTDVFTNRPVRTFFRDKQIHINGDIVYAIWLYYQRTDDQQRLLQAAPLIYECTRFYVDYCYYSVGRNRYEILDVLGPDEYHERVNNNAFTNRLIAHTLDVAIAVHMMAPTLHDVSLDEVTQWKHVRSQLFLPQPNQQLIIEQFDRYFHLHEVDLKTLLSRKIHPNEYLGGYGLAGDTQIIKQADVITMQQLFPDDYSLEIQKANWDFYEPRTEHGSSLSASMYAIVACRIGNPNYAYPLFIKSATVDLTGLSKHYAGGIYIGGTHPAANGGAYMTAVMGFAGLRIINNQLILHPHLPDSIQRMQFDVYHLGTWHHIEVTKDTHHIIKEST